MTAQLDVEALVGRLRELRARATQGDWMVQDGCSWRRIGTYRHDGDVLCPTNCRNDGQPDLIAADGKREDNLRLIVAAVNALPAILAHIAGESARVAAAVAGERERCWGIADRAVTACLQRADGRCVNDAKRIANAIGKVEAI